LSKKLFIGDGSVPDGNSWKEHLAFVSGYGLVFGFAVLKLWPAIAKFQTDMSINFWTANFPQDGVKTELGHIVVTRGLLVVP
jgi:hypothetical protein